jgi:hypothetical protein
LYDLISHLGKFYKEMQKRVVDLWKMKNIEKEDKRRMEKISFHFFLRKCFLENEEHQDKGRQSGIEKYFNFYFLWKISLLPYAFGFDHIPPLS